MCPGVSHVRLAIEHDERPWLMWPAGRADLEILKPGSRVGTMG